MSCARTGLLLACVALCGACSQDEVAGGREAALPFELERLEGGRVRLADLEGKLVLLDFWATWCPPCVMEVPELNAFHAEHRERVELLAIAIDGADRALLATWLDKHGVGYPVAIGDEQLARQYGADAFPFHVLISRDGRILERLDPGYHDRSELRALIERHDGG